MSKVLEIIDQFEVPLEYHDALWAAYSEGAEMGFWKAYEALSKPRTSITTETEPTQPKPMKGK